MQNDMKTMEDFEKALWDLIKAYRAKAPNESYEDDKDYECDLSEVLQRVAKQFAAEIQ